MAQVVAPAETATGRRYAWPSAAVVFVAVFAFRFLSFTGFPNDHFVYVARAQQILLDAWPVRDFVDPGFPLMYVASAAGLIVFGHNLLGEAVLVFGGFAAAAALSYGLARAAAGSAWVAVGAVALQAFAHPRSLSYPKLPLHALAIAMCWAYLARPTPARRVALAALTAIAFLLRPDHGAVTGLMALGAVVWAERGPLALRTKAALGLAAATMAFLLPWAIFVQRTTGLGAQVQSLLGFTSGKVELGRMGWPTFSIDQTEAWPGLTTEQNTESFLYYTFLLLPIVGAVVLLRRRAAAAPMPDAARRLLVVIVLAVWVDATLLRNPLANRLAVVAVPHTILAAWLVPAAWWALGGSPVLVRVAGRAAVAAGVGLLTLAVVQFGRTLERLDRISPLELGALAERATAVTHALRDIEASKGVPGGDALAPAPLIVYLRQCTEPDDRVLYLGYAPQTYFFAHRGFAGGQVVFEGTYYSSQEEQNLTLRRLRRERVPVVALPDENAGHFRRTFGAVAAYVDANYARAGTIDLPGDRRGDVFLDRKRIPVGRYEPLGWPCFAPAP